MRYYKSQPETLCEASSNNKLSRVQYMLSNGESPNQKDSRGRAPLHYAAYKGFTEIIQLLIKTGDRNITDKNGITPMHYAAQRDLCTVMKLLLGRNANINITDFRNRSPLYHALALRSNSAASFLIQIGADTKFLTKNQQHKDISDYQIEINDLAKSYGLEDNPHRFQIIERALFFTHFEASSHHCKPNINPSFIRILENGLNQEINQLSHEQIHQIFQDLDTNYPTQSQTFCIYDFECYLRDLINVKFREEITIEMTEREDTVGTESSFSWIESLSKRGNPTKIMITEENDDDDLGQFIDVDPTKQLPRLVTTSCIIC